jgi:hypothetical protein
VQPTLEFRVIEDLPGSEACSEYGVDRMSFLQGKLLEQEPRKAKAWWLAERTKMLGHVNLAEFRAEYYPQSAVDEIMQPTRSRVVCTMEREFARSPVDVYQVVGPDCDRVFQIVVVRSFYARQLTNNCRAQIIFFCCDLHLVDP